MFTKDRFQLEEQEATTVLPKKNNSKENQTEKLENTEVKPVIKKEVTH